MKTNIFLFSFLLTMMSLAHATHYAQYHFPDGTVSPGHPFSVSLTSLKINQAYYFSCTAENTDPRIRVLFNVDVNQADPTEVFLSDRRVDLHDTFTLFSNGKALLEIWDLIPRDTSASVTFSAASWSELPFSVIQCYASGREP